MTQPDTQPTIKPEPAPSAPRRTSVGYRFARLFIYLFMRLVSRVDVRGIENIPPGGGFLIAANHLGRLDPILVYYYLDRDNLMVMVAEKYQKVAFFRWFVKQLKGIFINRFNPDLTALREALTRLKNGDILVMAPEGTRSKSEALIEARNGVSYLASKSGALVVPVAITGSEDRVVYAGWRRLRRAQIKICVGKPFTLPPLKGGDREAKLTAFTDEIMCRIAAMLPEKYRGFYRDHPRLKEILASGEAQEFSLC